jgi:hypothetical protein
MQHSARNFAILLLLALGLAWSSDFQCSVGPRFEKTIDLFWENGAEVACSSSSILWSHLGMGASITSTRIGSAFESNALQQEQYLLNARWIFRPQKRVEPYVGINAGWFWLNVENEALFGWMPHSAPLFAVGAGTSANIFGPVWCSLGVDYHLITGDGNSGPGSLYPCILHASILWRFAL